MKIREARLNDLSAIARIVSESNKDVAEKFGLTADNCPKHPSFCTMSWIKADFNRGERYFLLENNNAAVACVAYEVADSDLAYLNRLAVLPAFRRKGIGTRLVQHIIGLAQTDRISSISIGIIGEHTELQRWYSKQGFIGGETKRFPHLPFSVRYMSYAV